MEIVLSEDALFMADAILSDARSLFGEKAFKTLRERMINALKRIEWSPRSGSLETALQDEDGEFRFILLNKRFKMIYKVVDEEHIRVLTFWDMRQNPENMRLVTIQPLQAECPIRGRNHTNLTKSYKKEKEI